MGQLQSCHNLPQHLSRWNTLSSGFCFAACTDWLANTSQHLLSLSTLLREVQGSAMTLSDQGPWAQSWAAWLSMAEDSQGACGICLFMLSHCKADISSFWPLPLALKPRGMEEHKGQCGLHGFIQPLLCNCRGIAGTGGGRGGDCVRAYRHRARSPWQTSVRR